MPLKKTFEGGFKDVLQKVFVDRVGGRLVEKFHFFMEIQGQS